MKAGLKSSDRALLRRFLVTRFSLEELKDVAFDIGVDFELLSCTNKQAFARELINHCERIDQLSCLLAEVLSKRHDAPFAELLAKLPACPRRQIIQVIVPAFLIKSELELREALATMFRVKKDEVTIIAVAAGSMRLLVGLPESAAYSSVELEFLRHMTRHRFGRATHFESLGPVSQKAWRIAACDWSPVRLGRALRPAISWEKALEMARGDYQITRLGVD